MAVRASGGQPDPALRRTSHDWEEAHPLAVSVAQLIAELEERSPTEIPPLQESVDMEHVESVLIDPWGMPREDITVEFSHAGYEITVNSLGEIEVASPE